jgi:hypothetical protein
VNRDHNSQNDLTYSGLYGEGRVFADFTEGRNSITERSGIDVNGREIRSN